jgi:hypothetical protein
MKPLNGKAYESIGHLPMSRLGLGDHHVHDGQGVICTTKARDRHDRIVVTEKVDGACTCVAHVDGEIVALIRAGYRARDGRFEHLRLFGRWFDANRDRFDGILRPGERLVGEWMALAHGTVYEALPSDPWIVFDAFSGPVRLPMDEVMDRAVMAGLATVPVISDGPPISTAAAMGACGPLGAFGAVGGPEGVVYRVERMGKVDFLAKYVRPDKVDGVLLPDVSGGAEIWNWRPAA